VHDPRQPDPVDELCRQVERASLFSHASLDRGCPRIRLRLDGPLMEFSGADA
jgi:hypothetical protein